MRIAVPLLMAGRRITAGISVDLTWSGGGARLTLTDARSVLPVTETLTTHGETKVVALSGWGRKFTVGPPGSAIPYSSLPAAPG